MGKFLGEATALNTDRAKIAVITIESQDTILDLAVEAIAGIAW